MINAKRKKKRNKDPHWGLDLAPCLLFLGSDPSSGLTGLEPAASALTGRCSDQLNYNPREIRDLAEIWILFFISVSSIFEGQGGYTW